MGAPSRDPYLRALRSQCRQLSANGYTRQRLARLFGVGVRQIDRWRKEPSAEFPRRTREKWEHRAACRDHDPRWWTTDSPKPGIRVPTETQKEAIAICNRCPVQDQCLDYALAEREPAGIWGGKTVRARTDILKRRRADAREDEQRSRSQISRVIY